MNGAAAFSATYSDFKLVRGRKVCQIVLEIPIEQADAALSALGGVPRPDAETWVGVARIQPKATQKLAPGTTERERQKWRDLGPAKQAAIRCQETVFQRFMAEIYGSHGDEESTVEAVRSLCSVTSRADILDGTRAAESWRKIDNEFQAWKVVG